jgi:hypothetical protein
MTGKCECGNPVHAYGQCARCRYRCEHGRCKYRCRDCGTITKPYKVRRCQHGVQKVTCAICTPWGRYVKYRGSAKQRDLEFTITFPQFKWLIELCCKYCGRTPAQGLDRIDSAVGYILSNCMPCCTLCNRMKSDFTMTKFLDHIEGISTWQHQ